MDDLLKVAVGMLLASLALAWVATFARLIVLRSSQIRIQGSGALVRAHGSAVHVTALYGLLRCAHPAPNSGMLDGGDRRLHESEPIHIPCPQSRCDTDMVAQDLQGREFPHHNYRERLDRLDDLSGSWLIQIGDCGRAPAGLNKRLLTGWNGCDMFETHLYGLRLPIPIASLPYWHAPKRLRRGATRQRTTPRWLRSVTSIRSIGQSRRCVR
jgi:hypothetical protein